MSLDNFPEKIRFVEQGLLGFETLTHYTLSAYDAETPFYWLKTEDENETAFLVIEPGYFIEDYSFELDDESLALLGIQDAQEVGVLVLLSIPENPIKMTANLLGPIVFHRESGKSKQLVLDSSCYTAQYPVLSEDTASVSTNPQT